MSRCSVRKRLVKKTAVGACTYSTRYFCPFCPLPFPGRPAILECCKRCHAQVQAKGWCAKLYDDNADTAEHVYVPTDED